jgi:hypothetical protein
VIHNEDDVWHGPFSVSHVRVRARQAPAGVRRHDLVETTGVVAVRCDIHPTSAFVAARTARSRSRSGRQLPASEPPAGHYVVAWHPDLGNPARGGRWHSAA